MYFRKFISFGALLVLMLGQIALADHSASHIDHEFSEKIVAFHDHDGHHHDEKNNQHECSECLLSQLLQTASLNSPAVFPLASKVEEHIIKQQSFKVAVNRSKANSPRAPPVDLI